MDNFYEPRQISYFEQTTKCIKTRESEKQYQHDLFLLFVNFIIITVVILGCLILLIIMV